MGSNNNNPFGRKTDPWDPHRLLVTVGPSPTTKEGHMRFNTVYNDWRSNNGNNNNQYTTEESKMDGGRWMGSNDEEDGSKEYYDEIGNTYWDDFSSLTDEYPNTESGKVLRRPNIADIANRVSMYMVGSVWCLG